MFRFLFFILTIGFFIQSSGAAVFLKKMAIQAEQSAEDSQKSEEKGKEENKSDQQHFEAVLGLNNFFKVTYYIAFHNEQSYPSGFFAKPFLPPRHIA